MGIDVNRIKQYNNRVTESKQKVAQDRAEIEVSRREIKRLCDELSAELGIEVNENNIEQIYNEHVKNILTQVENGEAILARIDEAAGGNVGASLGVVSQQVGNVGTSSYGANVSQQLQAGQMFAGQVGAVVQPAVQQGVQPQVQQGAPINFGFPAHMQIGNGNTSNNGGNTFSI